MSKTNLFSGVLPVVPTPFLDDASVDERSLVNIVRYAIACGVNAVVYPGVASEDIHLSTEERARCVELVVKTAQGKVKVIAGVNSADASEMVSLSQTMAGLGVDGIMAMAVPSMAEKGFAYWFNEIAIATHGLPTILQNLFAPRGADLSAEEMLALGREVNAIRYVKEEGIPSGPKVSTLIQSAGDYLDGVIGGGGARYVFDELERGVVATMPAIELLELHVAMLDAYFDGHRTKALTLYEASLPMLLMQAPYRMRLTKFILKSRGLIKTDIVREALPMMDATAQALLLEFYDKLEFDRVNIDD